MTPNLSRGDDYWLY